MAQNDLAKTDLKRIKQCFWLVLAMLNPEPTKTGFLLTFFVLEV